MPWNRRTVVVVLAVIASFACGAVTVALLGGESSGGAADPSVPTTSSPAATTDAPEPTSGPTLSSEPTSSVPKESTTAAMTTTIPTAGAADPAAGATEQPATSAGPAELPATAVDARFVADFASSEDLDLFDWQVSHNGLDPFTLADQPRQWHGDHDMDCGAPTTSREVQLFGETGPGSASDAGDHVWWCAPGGAETGHVMTAFVTPAYGHVDFSPRQVFDDVERICWDQNWTDMGGRKWMQLVVVPEDTFQANGGRLDYVSGGVQDDVAFNGLPVEGDTWMMVSIHGFTAVQVGQTETYSLMSTFRTDDRARRFQHCATDLGDGTVRFDLERPNGTEVRIAPGSFPDGPARVIFQDASYDSLKGDIGSEAALSTNTWHWDNIKIS